MTKKNIFNEDTFVIANAISSLLKERGCWHIRNQVAYYVDLCIRAGFCKTDNDIRLCAERYLAGKRKVTPPGTQRKKQQAKERKKLLSNIPQQLLDTVKDVVLKNEKAVQQYKSGNEKAINALIGQVIKVHRYEATVIKDLLISAAGLDSI